MSFFAIGTALRTDRFVQPQLDGLAVESVCIPTQRQREREEPVPGFW